jgi:DNA modification methylase
VRSPKLVYGSVNDRYYRYYAGYTLGFVEDTLKWLEADKTTRLADPWNGSGTTIVAAAAHGIRAVGFDLNPAAVLIGRSRLLPADEASSLVPLGTQICQHSQNYPVEIYDDPLSIWFGSNTVRKLRSLERAAKAIVGEDQANPVSPALDSRTSRPILASAIYVALFNTVRQLAQRYVPSNPAWIKNPSGRRIGIPVAQVHQTFISSVERLAKYLESPLRANAEVHGDVHVSLASSTNLPLQDSSIDIVISSPPYCTRLDYVKATLLELSVLGLQDSEVRRLRDRMIGTPTMASTMDEFKPEIWGDAVNALLTRIEKHPSKASATYYSKYYLQYFNGMWNSLRELRRVTKPDATAVLVIQDSYYKDIHVDLPALIGEMSHSAGWAKWSRVDFKPTQTMASIHPGSRSYDRPMRCIESAVILRR